MTVGLIGWLQRNTIHAAGGIAATTGKDVIAPLLCKQFALFRGELATTAASGTPTNHHRANVVHIVACASVEPRAR